MAPAVIGAVLYVLWRGGIFLPGWICWEDGSIPDSSGSYEITLAGKKVHVTHGGEEIWDSPQEVKVQQILSCDMDRDDCDELILLCWRRGRFGKYKPFWIREDEKRWSQHIFVYEYAGDDLVPKWMSSYIGQEVARMAFGGEKDYNKRLFLTDPGGTVSYWYWDSWGFTREEGEVSFVVFGDNLIHEPIRTYGLNHEGNFDFLFDGIRDTLPDSDIAVINQETPFVKDPAQYGDYPIFGTPVQVGEAVVKAGFDIVTCATNHALDRGAAGIHTTKEFFTEHDVLCLGIQSPEEKERRPCEFVMRNNMKFALFNVTYGTNGISLPEENPYMVHLLENEELLREDIGNARKEADAVIMFVHWGTEDSAEVDEFQRKWTEFFLDCKVDVVVGTHPHVMQPFEMLESGDGHKMLVYYSIGNFVSAQPEKACVKGGMAKFTIAPTPEGIRVKEYDLTPLTILWQKGGGYRPVIGDK